MRVFCYLLLPVLMFASCEEDKDACDRMDELGAFTLLDESKAALPYTAGDQRAIFVNEEGEERALNIDLLSSGFVTQQFTAACPVDASMLSNYVWEAEKICYELEDEATGSFSYQLCVEMQYNLVRVAEKEVADLLSIEAYSSSSRLQLEGNYDLLLAPRNFVGEIVTEGTVELFDALSFFGRTYQQVFKLESTNNIGLERELYYTKAQGLVAFPDYFNDSFYVFDRIE